MMHRELNARANPRRRRRTARTAWTCVLTSAVLAISAGAAPAEERGETAARTAAATRALARSECGPTGCPARRPRPWQNAAGFALAVAVALWAAPRPPGRSTPLTERRATGQA